MVCWCFPHGRQYVRAPISLIHPFIVLCSLHWHHAGEPEARMPLCGWWGIISSCDFMPEVGRPNDVDLTGCLLIRYGSGLQYPFCLLSLSAVGRAGERVVVDCLISCSACWALGKSLFRSCGGI